MWAMGMSLGIILIDLTQGYKANLMSYTKSDLRNILIYPSSLSQW